MVRSVSNSLRPAVAAARLSPSRANTSLVSEALHAAQNRRELRSPSGAPATNARSPFRAVSDDNGDGGDVRGTLRNLDTAAGVSCDTGLDSATYGFPVSGRRHGGRLR